jgi:hypothetical protein
MRASTKGPKKLARSRMVDFHGEAIITALGSQDLLSCDIDSQPSQNCPSPGAGPHDYIASKPPSHRIVMDINGDKGLQG